MAWVIYLSQNKRGARKTLYAVKKKMKITKIKGAIMYGTS